MENLLRKGISHWFGITVPPVVLRYVNQLVHQESLFFVIPFFFITTAWNTGQVFFTSVLIAAALVSIIDPIYYHWLAARRWLYYCFHGITLFAALLTALPLIFHLPTPQSYLWSLGIAVLLTGPGLVRSMSVVWWKRTIAVVSLMLCAGGFGILVRPWIPPASLWLTKVAITDHIDDRNRAPKQQFKTITSAQLHAGIYAYTAIHAPRGLRERIYHQWIHKGKKFDKIALNISGGNDQGYQTWTHKTNFPADAKGDWQIQVVTEANQIIGILRFQVVDAEAQTKPRVESASREQRPSSSSISKQTSAPAVALPDVDSSQQASSTPAPSPQ
ncbi:hypothetical protein GCM10011613_02220 [Cellvibrio zantedeschiae]|uniref:DUF2914 domain-containing protein n=2 Tax=Cellvibrio zantedeschiae TaxID=1237077 RepID=A0ABQ3AMV1_9GAMM|nr:hypothetical protein GCM10011613_02220 [Cellvibrio zantedeschiae]